ncbi:MAG TPA: DUF1819 family protein [Thermoanaerobaculia bacterium]|nr:DUF1819 family protein [Thermoanaerobaculia bacterium]HQN07112.1 DUF1819 family protein [Thermoanaerobaculia bacterium]HQP84829.1 DUF1819 family protein [Thermoanaerobaculia bacterium]
MIGEERRFHTRLQKTTLAVVEARAYWAKSSSGISKDEQARRAFEERWFGARSAVRVRVLLESLRARFDTFPEAFAVLRRWRTIDPVTRVLVCHWHLQLSDPLYRAFAGTFLPALRRSGSSATSRGEVLRWMAAIEPARWGPASRIQLASKLLTAAREAGLIGPGQDARAILLPSVPDVALGYLLHLLRGVRTEGSITENPYAASIGLEGEDLEKRLARLPWLSYRKQSGVVDVEWAAPDLSSWAEAVLSLEAA